MSRHLVLLGVSFILFASKGGSAFAADTTSTNVESPTVGLQRKQLYCGPNSLCILLRCNGINVEVEQVRKMFDITENGVSVDNVLTVSDQLGLPLQAVRVLPDKDWSGQLPAIAYSEFGGGHFCVVLEYNRTDHEMQVFDGSTCQVHNYLPEGEFCRNWTGVLLVPKHRSYPEFIVSLGIVVFLIATVLLSKWYFPRFRSSLVIIIVALLTISIALCLRASSDPQPKVYPSAPPLIRSKPIQFTANPLLMNRKNNKKLHDAIKKVLPIRSSSPRTLHEMLHALRLLGRSFSYPGCVSSKEMLTIIFDTSKHEQYYGIRSDNVGRTQRLLIKSPYGFSAVCSRSSFVRSLAPHNEKVFQVAGEIGLPTDWRVIVEGQDYTLRDGIVDALSRINLYQELEFSTVALVHYLPPLCSWRNRQGGLISFESIALRLLSQESGACFNIHRLYALTMLLRAQQMYPLLSPETVSMIKPEIRTASLVLSKKQKPSGLWDGSLFDKRLTSISTPSITELLTATGHHLEWIAMCPEDIRPSPDVINRAVAGLIDLIIVTPQQTLDMEYGPLTHAVRSIMLLTDNNVMEILHDVEHD